MAHVVLFEMAKHVLGNTDDQKVLDEFKKSLVKMQPTHQTIFGCMEIDAAHGVLGHTDVKNVDGARKEHVISTAALEQIATTC